MLQPGAQGGQELWLLFGQEIPVTLIVQLEPPYLPTRIDAGQLVLDRQFEHATDEFDVTIHVGLTPPRSPFRNRVFEIRFEFLDHLRSDLAKGLRTKPLAALACKEDEWNVREKEFKLPAGQPRLITTDGNERLLDDQSTEALPV